MPKRLWFKNCAYARTVHVCMCANSGVGGFVFQNMLFFFKGSNSNLIIYFIFSIFPDKNPSEQNLTTRPESSITRGRVNHLGNEGTLSQ